MKAMYIGNKRGCRSGICAWCGNYSQKLTYTVYSTAKDYRQADVCKGCLMKYEQERKAANHDGMDQH